MSSERVKGWPCACKRRECLCLRRHVPQEPRRERVFVASPFAGDEERHGRYLDACLRDSIGRGEAPFAPHAIYTRVMAEGVPGDRDVGIAMGLEWMRVTERVAFYVDLGDSDGMVEESKFADDLGLPVSVRVLGGEWRTGGGSAQGCDR